MFEMDEQTVIVLAAAVVLGGILGGAVGHWRRGKEMIATGAIIGAIALPIISVLAVIYVGVGLAAAGVVLLLGILSGVLG